MLLCKLIVISLLFGSLYGRNIKVTKDLQYQPTWDSLDKRPLPKWYDKSKIGIFIHWGVFSVPSFGSEWFWNNWKGNDPGQKYIDFMKKNYPPNFTYQDFGPQFTAEFFDPDSWADLFASSGAQYVVITSKHHEGYCLWPSKHSFSWNSVDVGPHRDIIGELSESVRSRTNLTFGLYHSLYEWFNPLWLDDKANNFSTNNFVTQKTMPELYELVNTYKPDVIWSDGEWDASDTYWQSKEFLTWLYNSSPVKDSVVVNDRWGHDTACHHGGFLTCADRYNPGVLQNRKWENALSLDLKSWGFRRDANISNFMTINELLNQTITTISCGGNVLLNVGPTKEGTIIPIFQERLLQLGSWLNINGEAIYSSKPWSIQNDSVTSNVWYTNRPDLKNVYALFQDWPIADQVLVLENDQDLFSPGTKVSLLNGDDYVLKWEAQKGNVLIDLPPKYLVKSDWWWTLKISSPTYYDPDEMQYLKSNNV